MRAPNFHLSLSSLAEAIEFCTILSRTEAVPVDDRGKPGNILAKIQAGAEIGVPAMQAIRHLYCVDGRVGMEVTLMLALVEASGLLADKVVEADDDLTVTVTLTRTGRRPYVIKFGPAEAAKAGLLNNPKKDTYRKWDWRMYYNRAMGFALQDVFPDVLRGVVSLEYLRDSGISVRVEGDAPVEAVVGASAETQAQLTGEFERLRLGPARRLVMLQQHRGKELELLDKLRGTETPQPKLQAPDGTIAGAKATEPPAAQAGEPAPVTNQSQTTERVGDQGQAQEPVESVGGAAAMAPEAELPLCGADRPRRARRRVSA